MAGRAAAVKDSTRCVTASAPGVRGQPGRARVGELRVADGGVRDEVRAGDADLHLPVGVGQHGDRRGLRPRSGGRRHRDHRQGGTGHDRLAVVILRLAAVSQQKGDDLGHVETATAAHADDDVDLTPSKALDAAEDAVDRAVQLVCHRSLGRARRRTSSRRTSRRARSSPRGGDPCRSLRYAPRPATASAKAWGPEPKRTVRGNRRTPRTELTFRLFARTVEETGIGGVTRKNRLHRAVVGGSWEAACQTVSQPGASWAARSQDRTRLASRAMPFPAMSKAVPWSTERGRRAGRW